MKKIFTLGCGLLLMSAFAANEAKADYPAQSIKIKVQDYDYNNIAEAVTTELTKDDEGNYVITDFLWSGSPVKFTFEKPGIDGWADIKFTGNIEVDPDYPEEIYLLTKDGDYLDCAVENLEGVKEANVYQGWTWIYYPIALEDGYSQIYRYDASDPDNYYEYYASICLYGILSDGSYSPYLYLNFYFNDPVVLANQEAYDSVIAQLDALQEKYDAAVADIKEMKPDFDFSEWEEIGNMIEQYKGWAAQELAAANEDGTEFQFAFDSEEFDAYIQMMIMAGTPAPEIPATLGVTLSNNAGINLNVDDSWGIFTIDVSGKSIEEEITITVDVPEGWDGMLYMNGDDYDPGIDPLTTRAQETEWWPVADMMQLAGAKEGNSLTFPVDGEYHSGQFLLVKNGLADVANQINVEFEVVDLRPIIAANQEAYDKVMEEINAASSNYTEAVAFIEGYNPDFDLTEMKEIIGNAISEAQTGAEQALNVANEEGETFFFPFSAEEINAMITEMRVQAVAAPNEAAYKETLAKIEESEKEYKTTLDELMLDNPEFDFKEWKELIEFVLNDAKKGAQKALDSANENGTAYQYAYDGKEITALLNEMREEVKTSGIGSVNAADNAEYYDLNGNKISNPKAGMYIKVVDGKATKVVVK